MRLEIRAAEGGTDSKMFVKDLADAYARMFLRLGWVHHVLTERPGILVLFVEADKQLERQLRKECGGHRIQRIPPTERKGRVHTSTVTVAIIDDVIQDTLIDDDDIQVQWFSGTGKGGQHRNKHQNSCRMLHVPTGITSVCSTRSRDSSYRGARDELVRRVTELTQANTLGQIAQTRKTMVGSGMRGDKVKTYRFQDDQVVDHRTNKTASVKKVLRGHFDLLW